MHGRPLAEEQRERVSNRKTSMTYMPIRDQAHSLGQSPGGAAAEEMRRGERSGTVAVPAMIHRPEEGDGERRSDGLSGPITREAFRFVP